MNTNVERVRDSFQSWKGGQILSSKDFICKKNHLLVKLQCFGYGKNSGIRGSKEDPHAICSVTYVFFIIKFIEPLCVRQYAKSLEQREGEGRQQCQVPCYTFHIRYPN